MVREGRRGLHWYYVHHHHPTGKQTFSLQGRVLSAACRFWHLAWHAVAPRLRSVKLLQAVIPHLERLPVKTPQRRRTSAHLSSSHKSYRFGLPRGSPRQPSRIDGACLCARCPW